MSYNAERWARMQKAGNSRAKQVLIELAHCLNSETGLCCPSIAFLHEITELKEDTIMSAIKHLEGAGLVRKKRVGYKNRYQLVGFDPKKDYPENGVNLAPENGVYPENGGVSQERGIDTPENGVNLAPENGVLTGNKQGNNKECSFVHACDSAACPTVDDIPADVFGPDPDISNPPADLSTVKEKPAKEKTASKKGSRFNLETLPDEWAQAAKAIRPDVDPAKVFDEFRDYWIARPGAGGCKLDWLCVWRNWLRRMRRDEVERMSAGASSDAQKAQPYFSAQPQPTSQRLQAGAWFRKKTAPAMAANAVEDAHEAEMYEVLRRETGLK